MDASKAVQALTDGDWHGLALAIADRSMVLTSDTGHRLTYVTAGTGMVQVVDNPGDEPGSDMRMSFHQHDSVEVCVACWESAMEQNVQPKRAAFAAAGMNPGVLHVDGVLTPAPEGVGNPFSAMMAQIKQVMEQSGALVTVPDDARGLD